MIPGDESSASDKTTETFTETTIASVTDEDGVVYTTVTTISTTRDTVTGEVLDSVTEETTTINYALKNDENDELVIKLLAAQAALRDAQDALPGALADLEDALDNKLDQEIKSLEKKTKDVIKKQDKIDKLTAEIAAEEAKDHPDQGKIDKKTKDLVKEQGKLAKLLAEIDKINIKIAEYQQAVIDAEAALAAANEHILNATVLVSQINAALDRLSNEGEDTTTVVPLPPSTVGGAGTGSVGTGSTSTGRISWRKLVL